MKTTQALLAALTLAISIPAQAEETTLIAYPTVEEASFTIEVPDGWKMTEAESDGDFFHLDGPTGAIFSFRTIEGSEGALQAAIEDTMKHIGELFTEIELGDAQDWTPAGLTGFYATGSGKDKDGTEVRIGVAWCALNDGKIAQMWFVSDAGDASGMAAAESIANSLASPK
jgi:hypothetical protein